jgi:hypothetical protein
VLTLLGGDVETNPGPQRSQKQRTHSFAEVTSSPSGSVTFPTTSQEIVKRTTRATAGQDCEVSSFLRDMKNEMQTDLAAINSKIDDMTSAVNTLKSENHALRQEHQDMKKQM